MIRIYNNSRFNTAPKETYNKVVKRFSMFDGTGHDLTDCNTYDEALLNGDLDYSAEKQKIFLEDGSLIKNHYAMVKSDDHNIVLGVVGNQYKSVGNRDAFAIAEELVKEGVARYELGGPSYGAKSTLDYAKSFLVLRSDDFEIGDEEYNTFIDFTNSFDGSTGIQYQVICQRLVCLNGMIRYLCSKKDQLRINIQHSETAMDRIKIAQRIIRKRLEDVSMIQREAQAFIGTKMSAKEFKEKIIPLIIGKMGLVEKDKDRQRGKERIEKTVMQLMSCYNADDTQNYNDTAYKVILALSDFETHAEPLRNTGNRSVYLNRISKGMLLTTAAAQYMQNMYGIQI